MWPYGRKAHTHTHTHTHTLTQVKSPPSDPCKISAYACHSNDGTCFLSPTAQPMDFLEGQDFDPTLIRRIFSPFSVMKTRGLNHSAI